MSKSGPQREVDFSEESLNGHPMSSHRRHSNDSCLSVKRCICPVHVRDRCSHSSEISPLHTYCIYQNLLSNGHLPKSGKLAPQHMMCLYPEAACRGNPKRSSGRKMSPLCRSCTFHEMPARESMNSSSVSSLCETLDKAITTAGTVKQFLRDCSRERHKLMNETGSRKLSEPNIRRYGLGMVHNASCPSKLNASVDSTHIDDEHRLIARYAARLAADSHNAARSPTELNFCLDSNKAQRELIAQLEAKNREIMKEIQRLRVEQEAHAKRSSAAEYNPTLLAELRLLRQRKDELESRMQALQESRKELMLQLESLMKLLKNHGSPRSTPNSSPRSRSGQSPTTGMLPGGGRGSTPSTPMDSLSGLGGDVRQAFQQMPGSAANARNLRNDLLVAADSVTNAMSSLVKELNSEASGSDGEGEITKTANGGLDSGELFHTQESDDVSGWREEMRARLAQEQQFIAELRARRDRSAHSSRNTSDNEQEQYDGDMYTRTDDDRLTNDDCDSYVRTDDESVIRTDEEDAELYDNHPKIHIPLWNSDLGQFSVDVVFELAGRYTTDDESYRTDEESVIRTDDEEGGNTDWEESMKRWINR